MTKNGNGVRLTATAVSIMYGAAIAMTGTHLPSIVAEVLTYSPTMIGLLAVAFDLWLWKWPLLHRISGRPCIEGTWRGTIAPSGENPVSGEPVPWLIDAAIMIEQTFWSLAITLMTREGTSHSTSATITTHGESRTQRTLSYIYLNAPNQSVRDRSQPHYGAAQLQIAGLTPGSLSGSYWTDRQTTGDLSFHLLDRSTEFSNLDEVLQFSNSTGS